MTELPAPAGLTIVGAPGVGTPSSDCSARSGKVLDRRPGVVEEALGGPPVTWRGDPSGAFHCGSYRRPL